MRTKIKSEEEMREEARMKLWAILLRKSIVERAEPLLKEVIWVVKGRQNEVEHEKLLPDYCYNIFELFRRTLLKVYPMYSDTVTITDKNLVASVKTIEKAKYYVRIDWEKFGTIIGIAVRGL